MQYWINLIQFVYTTHYLKGIQKKKKKIIILFIYFESLIKSSINRWLSTINHD